jgi:hypothetical protein
MMTPVSVRSEAPYLGQLFLANTRRTGVRFKPRPIDPGAGPRGIYGELMREYREAAGLSLEIVAGKIGYDTSTLSRFERARRAIPVDVPPALDELFGTGRMFRSMYRMIEHDHHHPGRYRLVMEYEQHAVRIHAYAAQVIPGLLQTSDYARALLREGSPDASTDELDESVATRLGRQAIFARDKPPIYLAVLDEAVLRRPVGGPGTMRAQLASILPKVAAPRTTIRVIPFAHGAHPLLGSSLLLLTLPDGKVGAWHEANNHGWMVEDSDAVLDRQRAYDQVCAYALTPRESADMIKAAIEEYDA